MRNGRVLLAGINCVSHGTERRFRRFRVSYRGASPARIHHGGITSASSTNTRNKLQQNRGIDVTGLINKKKTATSIFHLNWICYIYLFSGWASIGSINKTGFASFDVAISEQFRAGIITIADENGN